MTDEAKKVVDALRFKDCIYTQCEECVCADWCDDDTKSLEEDAAQLIECLSAENEALRNKLT